MQWFRRSNDSSKAMTKIDGYFRVKEAAEYFDVSPNTLRTWGRSGKLPERRHPINGHRLDAKTELDELSRRAQRTSAKTRLLRSPE